MNPQQRQERQLHPANLAARNHISHAQPDRQPCSDASAQRPWVRMVAKAVAVLYLWQTILPVYAQTVLPITPSAQAPAGQRPIMDAANNGVPIVLVAPPSAAGVSRNQYDQFNVNQNGLILNNSTGNVQSQLGGWISGNLQLGPTPARIILNEVVSSNPSQLRGTIEVAGQRADIVVANPNGITCAGCGFLNTSRGTLTTGQPQFSADGAITGFDVRQGQLTIGSDGLNASNIEQLDLIARGLVIEGEVWAKNLNAIAGANQVLYGTLQAIVQAGSGAAPRFAVDIKDLGGMYANQIYMVATEQGLGVNSAGRLAALQGNLTLSANGDLTLKDSYAKQALQLSSNGSTTLSGQSVSDGATHITTTGTLTQQGTVEAQGALSMSAGALNNQGAIIQRSADTMNISANDAAVNSGTLYSDGALTLNAASINDHNGTLQAAGNLSLQGQSVSLSGSQLISGNHVNLAASAGSLQSSNSQINAGGNLTATATGAITNNAGFWQAQQNISLQGAAINNAGGTLLATGTLTVNTPGVIDNTTGNLLGSAAVEINAGQLNNNDHALVASDQATRITTTGSISNQTGVLSGKTGLTINTGGAALNNSMGAIVSDAGLDLAAGELNNSAGQIVSRAQNNGVTTINVTSLNNQQGVIDSAGKLNITTQSTLDNTQGTILSGTDATSTAGNAVLAAAQLSNLGGQIIARDALDIQTGTLVNDGLGNIQAVITSTAGATTISAGATSNVGGVISSAMATRLSTQTLDNTTGELSSAGSLTIDTAGQTLTNTGGRILANGDLDLHAGAVVSNAYVPVSGPQGAVISGGANVTIQAASLNNDGSVIAANSASGNVSLALGNGALSNKAGQISAGNSLSADAGTISNQNGQLLANNAVTLSASALDNTAGLIAAANDVTVQLSGTATLNNTQGSIVSNHDVKLAAAALDNTQGVISAGNHANVNLGSGTLTNTNGQMIAVQGLNLQSGAIVNRSGTLFSGTALAIDTQGNGLDNAGGTLQAGGDLTISTASLNNSGGSLQAAGNLNLQAGATSNQNGGLISGQNLDLTLGTINNTGGQVIAAGTLVASTQALNNQAGLIQAVGDATVNTNGQALVNTDSGSNGGIVSGATLTLQSGSLNNQSGFIASTGNNILTVAATLDNRGGIIAGSANTSLNAVDIDNRDGRIHARGDLAIAASGVLDNRGGNLTANGNATLGALTINNSSDLGSGGIIDATDVNLTATSFNNQLGVLRTARNAVINVGALDNRNGSLSAKNTLTITAPTLNNTNGDIIGDGGVVVSTNSQAPGGTIASQNDVTLNVGGDYTNTGLLSAQKNLTINAANISNSGTLKANDTLTANTGDLNNSGEISAANTLINASGTLTNSGLIDGATTQIKANTTNNTGRIYGDFLSIQSDTLNNSGTGTLAARDMLFVGGTTVNNTNGALIYAGNDIFMAGSLDQNGQPQGEISHLLNASAKIEAGRDINLSVANLLNRNDGLLTGVRSTTTPINVTLIQPDGSTAKYNVSDLGWKPNCDHDIGCYVLPSTTYPIAQFGSVRIPSTVLWSCSGWGDSQVCTSTRRYLAGDPIWALFKVPEASFSDLTQPVLPAGNGNCMQSTYSDIGDIRVTTGACGAYWTALDAYNQTVTQRIASADAALDAQIAAFNADVEARVFSRWNEYQMTSRTIDETVLNATDPAQILAGGALTIQGNGSKINDNSNLVAGGAITITGTAVDNRSTQGTRSTTDSGQVRFRNHVYHGGFSDSTEETFTPWTSTTGAPQVVTFDLGNAIYQQNGGNPVFLQTLAGSSTSANASTATGTGSASGNNRSAKVAVINTLAGTIARPADHRPPTIQSIAANGSGERAHDVILTTPPRLIVPTSTLFVIHPEPGSRTLVETDPRFTQYKNFISSDYALQQLNKDPERQLKRYGDGFVEQQLVNDQILALTGRRFLSGYSSTEDEYKCLMDNGVAFARQYQLTPGVALSDAQMANLTTDIVWLTTQTVTLPNGQTTQVLVPQVYLRRPQSGDLQANGALISGSSIAIQSERDLINSGSINASGSVTLLAGNDLVNQGGALRGQDIVARANNDLKNLSGTIQGSGTDSYVTLLAGRDIVLQTRTIDSSVGTGAGPVTSTRTSVDRIATLQGGTVRLDAGRDITAIGAVVKADNDLIATAGRDLTIRAVQGQYQLTIATGGNTMGRTGAIKENSTTNIASNLSGNNVVLVAQNDATISGSNLTAANNLQIQAANIQIAAAKDRSVTDVQNVAPGRYTRAMRDDEKLVGGNLNAGNNLTLQATGTATPATGTPSGGNITLTGVNLNAQAGQVTLLANQDLTIQNATTNHNSVNDSYSKKGGMLSGVTTTIANSSSATLAEGSIVSGNSVQLQAGQNLRVQGSAVAGDGDVKMIAGNDVAIAAATATRTEKDHSSIEETGFLSGGGFGISYGKRTTTTDQEQDGTTQSGQSRSMVGSNNGNLGISAGNAIKVNGSDLAAAQDVTLAGKSVTIDPGTDDSQGKFSTKMTQDGLTLAVGGTVVNAIQTAQTMSDAAAQSKNTRVKALAAATAAMAATNAAKDVAANGVSVSVSLTVGHSESEQTQTTASLDHSGSTINAGNNLAISATGGGKDSNITVIGSDLTAKNNLQLSADNQINLLAAQDTESQHSESKSMSASAGIAASVSTKGGMAFGVTGSLAIGRGNEDGEGTTQRNSHVTAGHQLSIVSGGDTTVKGAVVAGKQVTADIGGNLNIESLQDTAKFDSKNQSASISATVGYGANVSGSINQSKIKSDYASVQEQSGIQAGDEGFQINVAGNTDLKGAVIASTQAAIEQNKNSLITATLTQSDIKNHATMEAESIGLSGGVSVGGGDGKEAKDKGDGNQQKNPGEGKGPGGTNLINAGGGPNITDSKYEAGKVLIGNLLNNGSDSSSSSGISRSAISAGAITITNADKQMERTGKTNTETVASLNRDTVTANSVVQKQDVQEIVTDAQVRQAFKQAVFTEATKFTDESYRRIFLEKTFVYEVAKDDNGNIKPRMLTDDEKQNLKPASDGKVHVTNNGIFNNLDAASKYASQHSTAVDGPQYLIYFPEADNLVSELLIAGYQKFLEGDLLGLSNAAEENKRMMQQYGQSGLVFDDHSRGAMTNGNSLESVLKQPNAQGTLSGTRINFFGPAYNAEKADNLLGEAQGRDAVTDLAKKNEMVLRMQNHQADPVGRLIGMNPLTGGTIPEGSNIVKEAFNALGGDYTVHNCYGSGDQQCKDFWKNTPNNQPALKPVKIYPITQPQK